LLSTNAIQGLTFLALSLSARAASKQALDDDEHDDYYDGFVVVAFSIDQSVSWI
jgi:hypothetical protein